MSARYFGEAFVTLTVIMDPPGAVLIFMSLTALTDRREQQHAARVAVATSLVAIVAVHIVLFLALRFSWVIRSAIKDTGILLLTRVAGLLLAAIAVLLVADGVTEFVRAA